jgi:hypothetical protein
MQPIVKNMGTSFLSGRLFKFTFLVVGAGAMIFAWYMLTRSSQPESFRSESKQFVLSPLDSVKKKQNDSIVKEMQKQTGVLRQSGTNAVNLGTEKPDSSATQDVKERHSEDLLPADKKVKKAHGIKMPIDQQH